MYNFLLSSLSVSCALVLYDGSPLCDPAYLWRLTDDLKITIFGTSAKYIDQLAVSLPLSIVEQFIKQGFPSFRKCISLASITIYLHCDTYIQPGLLWPLPYMIMYTSIFIPMCCWLRSQARRSFKSSHIFFTNSSTGVMQGALTFVHSSPACAVHYQSTAESCSVAS